MSFLEITPNRLSGEIRVPSSKSMGHRAVICAALSEGESKIKNILFSEDINATLKGMMSLGAEVKELKEEEVIIKGNGYPKGTKGLIECNESGSTIRFLIPIASLVGEEVTFTGKGKLVERPLDIYYDIFKKQGIDYKNQLGKLPLTINGNLKAGVFKLRGDVSSQFITGLMFALPLLEGDSKIIVTSELESKPYVDLTMELLNKFSIDIVNNDYKEFLIKGGQRYKSSDYTVEGDYSQVAFWLTAAILGGEIKCSNLNKNSLQGDKEILNIIKKMGGSLTIEKDLICTKASKTKGAIIDASQCPDLVPIVSVLAALSSGRTEIINAGRLRIKESDRLKAMAEELTKLGANIKETKDGLIIDGKEALEGGSVNSWNDHRIAMALAVASIKCKKPVIIENYQCVKKSYPSFWEDFKKLGGIINGCSMGK